MTVFHTSVDLLCKKTYKSSSLLRYFNGFLSNHTMGCCNINFSCLSQIRRKTFALQAMSLYIFLYFFAWLQLFRCHVWPTFHHATPWFFVLASLFILIACWKTNFFLMFMGNYWERNGEREKFRLNRFPIVEAKSYFLHCSALLFKHFFAVLARHRWEAIKEKASLLVWSFLYKHKLPPSFPT